jgi:hypothetical protein
MCASYTRNEEVEQNVFDSWLVMMCSWPGDFPSEFSSISS